MLDGKKEFMITVDIDSIIGSINNMKDDYEDEYSHNEINEYKEKFIDKVIAYLHETKPGKYIVTSGWCVFIMTVNEAKKRKVRSLEELIIN